MDKVDTCMLIDIGLRFYAVVVTSVVPVYVSTSFFWLKFL